MDYLVIYSATLICPSLFSFSAPFHNGHADLDVACGKLVHFVLLPKILCTLRTVNTNGGYFFFLEKIASFCIFFFNEICSLQRLDMLYIMCLYLCSVLANSH